MQRNGATFRNLLGFQNLDWFDAFKAIFAFGSALNSNPMWDERSRRPKNNMGLTWLPSSLPSSSSRHASPEPGRPYPAPFPVHSSSDMPSSWLQCRCALYKYILWGYIDFIIGAVLRKDRRAATALQVQIQSGPGVRRAWRRSQDDAQLVTNDDSTLHIARVRGIICDLAQQRMQQVGSKLSKHALHMHAWATGNILGPC